MDFKKVVLEDGIEYAVIDEIEQGNITFVYLINVLDSIDFCIRKVDSEINDEVLVGLDSDDEFDLALNLFEEKHINDDLSI